MSDDLENDKYGKYGHGDHWRCLLSIEELLKNHLCNIFEKGKVHDYGKIKGLENTTGQLIEEQLISYSYPETDLAFRIISLIDRREERILLQTMYPCIRNTRIISLTIDRLIDWDENGIEGVVQGRIGNGNEFALFDINYNKSKGKYQIGETYDFGVAALAYSLEIDKVNEFEIGIDNPAYRVMSENGWSVPVNENGEKMSFTIDNSKLVALLSSVDEFPEDFTFKGPVLGISKFVLEDMNIYKIKTVFMRDPDVEGIIYVSEKVFDGQIEIGQSIIGSIWMQGYLVE